MTKEHLHIKSLELNNFRCFETLTLAFHQRLNVFFGENGSGKSSIIEAINIMLGNIISVLGTNTAVKTNFAYEDIFNTSKTASIDLTLYDNGTISFGMQGSKTITDGNFATKTVNAMGQLEGYVKNIIDMIITNENTVKLPIFVSYKSTRHTECFMTKNGEPYKLSAKACYDDAICWNIGYTNFFKWFKEREDLELQKAKKDTNYFDKQIQAVRNATSLVSNFSNFSFDREVWQFVLEKKKKQVLFNQLSDGERGYLLLVGDIARRLAIANPVLEDPLEGEGIILIDEIELHLHPKWQRTIISKLLEVFPHCQFIITSHSPQVLGEIEDANSIWILEEGEKPYHPSRAFGMESSELLREIMGAESRNADVSKELEEIDRLIDSNQFEEARSAIQTLSQKTGEIPAIIGANSYLTMMGQGHNEVEE